jgi:hypothetical protein
VPPGKHVIGQGAELIVAAVITQEGQRLAELLGQLRFSGASIRAVVGHWFLIGLSRSGR